MYSGRFVSTGTVLCMNAKQNNSQGINIQGINIHIIVVVYKYSNCIYSTNNYIYRAFTSTILMIRVLITLCMYYDKIYTSHSFKKIKHAIQSRNHWSQSRLILGQLLCLVISLIIRWYHVHPLLCEVALLLFLSLMFKVVNHSSCSIFWKLFITTWLAAILLCCQCCCWTYNNMQFSFYFFHHAKSYAGETKQSTDHTTQSQRPFQGIMHQKVAISQAWLFVHPFPFNSCGLICYCPSACHGPFSTTPATAHINHPTPAAF